MPPCVFDLEARVAGHTAFAKLNRLLFVAERSEEHRAEAVELALRHVRMCTINTELYKKIFADYTSYIDVHTFDGAWVKSTDIKAAETLRRIEGDLRKGQMNSETENVRLSFNELGEFHFERGQLKKSLQAYLKSTDYSLKPAHTIAMCINIIRSSISMVSFSDSDVLLYAEKARMKMISDNKADPILLAKLECSAGLARMKQGEYRDAARYFSLVPFELESNFSEVIAPSDVGLYGTLCALATYNRDELYTLKSKNQPFKNFLELVPVVRELLSDFYCSRYDKCIDYLKLLRPELELDIHVSHCLDELYKMIVENAMLQYCIPFSSIRLSKMATTFRMDIEGLEKEVCKLITAGKLMARIDSFNKQIFATQTLQRNSTLEGVLKVGNTFNDNATAVLLHTQMRKHGVVLRDTSKRL
tara:strand:+ start:1367 stop:2617 length:1251 start_codon:yes stop_codon:yes gene_type:complete